MRILSGRFGPYIKHGDTNANVPRGADPAAITLEEAVGLLAERAAKGGGKKKRKAPAKKKPAPKAEKAEKPKKAASAKAAPKTKPAPKKKTEPVAGE